MNSNAKKIKVAMVAPPFGSTGGPEVVVHNLTEALLKKGIDVTLFAPADWKTRAKHISTLKKSLWNMKDFSKQDEFTRRNYIISSQIKVLAYQDEFDIIHLHSQRYAYCVAANLKKPCVVSFHNKVLLCQYNQLKESKTKMVVLSNSQKGEFRVDSVINNGVPVSDIEPSFKKGKYLIVIGRIDDQKGIDIAIKIAKKSGKKLLIFGRKGDSEKRKKYFNEKVKPHINGKNIIYKGQISNKRLYKYIRGAEALLFTIRRPEVFGLVVAEALACGTPVIGTNINPLPEILKNKKVAYLSNDINKLIEVAENTERFDRVECRKYAEKYFDSSVMADKYIKLYRKIIDNKNINKKLL